MSVAKPKRPPGLAHGRWLGDLEQEKPLSAAEKALVAACAHGDAWEPKDWDGKRPEKATAANTIRADLIRFLLLGGDVEHSVHEEGVVLGGTWVSGVLSLHQAKSKLRLDAKHCHFAGEPILLSASLPELVLSGSQCPGLSADRLKVTGTVFLRDGFHATGDVRLRGAQIGGSLDCQGGRFEKAHAYALNADRLLLKGSLFLRDGFHATGQVRLLGAEIGSTLDCRAGRFENGDGKALNAGSVTVKGNLFLRDAKLTGCIDLAGAKVGTLVDGDDLSCWNGGKHILSGFHFDRIAGFVDAERRIEWLTRQRENNLTTNFKPQPWEQLITVLRDMGHAYEAGEVAIAKQKQMRVAGVIKGWYRRWPHWFYGKLIGYGHRPLHAVGWMAAVWLFCSIAFWAAADGFAAIGPNNPAITSATLYPDADKLCGHRNEPGKARWTECPGVPDEYSTFQPFIYSLDLILPLVDLQQESDWAPIAEGPTGTDLLPGTIARWLMWFEILFGWAMSLMLVAVLGRLVEKD